MPWRCEHTPGLEQVIHRALLGHPSSAYGPRRGQSQSHPTAPLGWSVHRTRTLVLTLQGSGQGALIAAKVAFSFTNHFYLQRQASNNHLLLWTGVRVPTWAGGSFPESGFINSIIYTKTGHGAARRCYIHFGMGIVEVGIHLDLRDLLHKLIVVLWVRKKMNLTFHIHYVFWGERQEELCPRLNESQAVSAEHLACLLRLT